MFNNRPRLLLLTDLEPALLEQLQSVADVDMARSLTVDDLQARLGQYQALLVGAGHYIDGQTLEYGYQLKAVGCLGARLDALDVSAARALGIAVCHSPGRHAVRMAEQTVGQILTLGGHDNGLAGLTLGVIGYGRIGQQVAQRAAAFDMTVLVNQPRLTPQLALDEGVEAVDLDSLLQRADIVSLHAPHSDETHHFLGAREFALFKPGALLVNTAHVGLVDLEALNEALELGRVRQATLTTHGSGDSRLESALRARPEITTWQRPQIPAQTSVTEASSVVEQILARLREKLPSETLALDVVPSELVTPHEEIDEKRVERLMAQLERDELLINPPLVAMWNGRYVVLDGATRTTAFKRLNYPFTIVQIVDPESDGFDLHTWYHAIRQQRPFSDLIYRLKELQLTLTPLAAEDRTVALQAADAICYLIDNQNEGWLISATGNDDPMASLSRVVATYTNWGTVERTLISDVHRLRALYPDLSGVAVFPQLRPVDVFEGADNGQLLPAGLTRFVIPGRILRLNADLLRLRKVESLTAKRAWFNDFLADKLARSRMRYYQEPVILLDE